MTTKFSGDWVYDVFLSFCGEDVRVTFLSHFLKELNRKLINVFKDTDIERSNSIGPEQVRAIKDSRIAVIVFSKNYASSRWCLSELLEIVKCQKELGQLLVPIFYGVDPSHVRKQTDDVGKIFEETCPNVTEEMKNQLREALTIVANTAGYHSATWDNEAKKIEEITNDAFLKVIFTMPEYSEDLVGMDDHIAKMILLLQLESEEVRMIGIWGSLGIGKTTIARVLFKQLSRHFQGSVYIDKAFVTKSMDDYGEAHPDGDNMKLHLQRNFLSNILGEKDITINQLGEFKEKLMHQKVLIIVDDLDNRIVLDALAGDSQWFGSGSRIIAVTNDKDLLLAHGISCIHKVDFPTEELALKIFCYSAFSQTFPPEGFEELAVEVAKRAGRLPLALKVLGSSLRGRSNRAWMEILRRLQDDIKRNVEVEDIMRFSYDSLLEEDKSIFRHIACLFNLKKVNDISLLLADSGLNFEEGLRNLVAKSFVHVRLNMVEMHPLLQSMGKEIVREQSDSPGEREFLIDSTDICDVLENNTGGRKVLGISLNIDEIDELHIHKLAFKRMPNLRFLTVFSNRYIHEKKVRLHLPPNFDHLPPRLKLLCWDRYPMKSMPSKFCPEYLVKLEMKNSKLEKLWEGSWKLRCLREMNLWGSENLKDIPDISLATNLEKLYLGYCLSWVKHPSSIRNFNELTNSCMLECKNLETLPTGINLESPKSLILKGFSHSRLENLRDGMQPLIRRVTTLPASLRVLFLTDIPNMVELPFSIKNLNRLTDLSITRCINLETLPTGINLESLERLNLNGCSRLRTFPNISTNISTLYLEETAIKEVPWWIEDFSKLKHIYMERCSKLEYVNLNISKLKHLEVVYFSHCGALTSADWNGYRSGMALGAENIDMKLPDHNVPKVDFRFTNCFNLDREAILQQLPFEKLILSGEEMPLYFTYQTTRTSLTNIPLLLAPLSPPFFRFKACALVVFKTKPTYGPIGVYMHATCRFISRRGNHLESPGKQEYFSVYQKGSHLLLLDCVFRLSKSNAPLRKMNYENVDIQFHMRSDNSEFEIKRWGIRHSTNTLQQICEANVDSIVNDSNAMRLNTLKSVETAAEIREKKAAETEEVKTL